MTHHYGDHHHHHHHRHQQQHRLERMERRENVEQMDLKEVHQQQKQQQNQQQQQQQQQQHQQHQRQLQPTPASPTSGKADPREGGERLCTVCQKEATVEARALGCDHLFCLRCLKDGVAARRPCPECRAPLVGVASARCTGCLREMGDGRLLAGLDGCEHTFCYPCLRDWSRNDRTCPRCAAPFAAILHDLEENACLLCFGEVEVRSTPNSCRHEFCFRCLRQWSAESCECPQCAAPYTGMLSELSERACLLCLAGAKVRCTPDSCDHPFCYPCLRRWRSSRGSVCPQCRVGFARIVTADAGAPGKGGENGNGERAPGELCRSCFDEVVDRSTTDACDHPFCYRCIRDRSRLEPSCPECGLAFRKILGRECALCSRKVEDESRGATDSCDHVFCYDCLKGHHALGSSECPVCRTPFSRVFHLVVDFVQIFGIRLRLGAKVKVSELGRPWNFDAYDDEGDKWYGLVY